MRYISLFIGGILAFSACNEVKFAGNDSETGGLLTAGFRDTLITVFENAGKNKLTIDFSQLLARETKVTVAVAAEENMQENKDYFITAKELAVAVGGKSADIEYALVDDNKVNDSRSFTLKLMSVNGGVVDEQHAVTKVKVLDDESDVAVGFETTALTVAERESGGTAGESYRCEIPVKIYGTLRKPLQFKVALLPTEGANAAIENVNFRLLQTVFVVENATDALSVPIEIIDDIKVNADRMFTLDITEVTGAEMYTPQKRCIVTIANDDMGIYFGKAQTEAEEGTGIVKIPVKLTRACDSEVSFTLSAEGLEEGTDYALTKEWTIGAGEDEVEIEVEVKHVEGIQPDRMLTLGFANVGEGLQVFDEQPNCKLNIWDIDTKVDFKYGEWGIKDSRGTVQIPIVLQQALMHNVSFTMSLDLSSGSQATITSPEVTIPAGQTSAVMEVKITQMSQTGRGVIMSIGNVKGATSGGRMAIINKYGDIAAPYGLTIAGFSSEQATGEPAPSGPAAAAIDGSESSYWHSLWSGAGSSLPQYIVVKIPDKTHVAAVDVIRRVADSNSDTKTAEISLSEDKLNWDFQGTLNWSAATGTDRAQHLRSMVFNHMQKGGYIKINITDGFRNFGQVSEVVIYGYTE